MLKKAYDNIPIELKEDLPLTLPEILQRYKLKTNNFITHLHKPMTQGMALKSLTCLYPENKNFSRTKWSFTH